MPKPKSKSIRGMGIIADPYRGPAKKRGGKRPARPGWGQALLGRSRRGWSHGGDVGPMNVIDASTPVGRRKARALGQYTGPIGVGRTMSGGARARAATQTQRQASRSPGGWSLGGALNSKRKDSKRTGYQQGRALTPRAVKKAWGYNRPYDPRDLTRQLASPHQVGNVNAAIQAGKVQHFGPSSGGSVKRPPGGWNRGGPAKFRDDQSLGIRGGVVRKPVGYQGGGALASMKGDIAEFPQHAKFIRGAYKQRRQNILSGKHVSIPAPKRKRISTKKGGGG